MSEREAGQVPDLGFAHGPDPHRRLAELRRRCPVTEAVSPDGNRVHVVLGYSEARAALTDPRLRLDNSTAAEGVWTGLGVPQPLAANLLNRDGADHERLRGVGAGLFTKAAAEEAAPRILELARKAVAELPADGEFDAVADLAEPVAVGLLCSLFGVDPTAHRTRFVEWTHTLLSPDAADKAQAGTVIGELLGLFGELVAARAVTPGADLPTAAAEALAAGVITRDELTAVLFSHWLAGAENAIHMIGYLLLRILTDDGLRATVADADFDDPAWDEVLDEVLRLDGSLMMSVRRFPAVEVTLGGVDIPAGHPVLIGLAAADRDPDRFPDPDAVLLGRGGGHLAFGAGAHYCPGAALARVEVKAAVFALLERWPDAAMAGDPSRLEFRRSTRTRGLRRLPVTPMPISL